jgi:hypothetical protein
MTSRQRSLLQDDFSSLEVRDVAPALIPSNGAYTVRNGLGIDDGSVLRRGGSEYLSASAFGSRGTLLWDGQLGPGERTFFASPADFGVLAADDTTPVNLGSDGLTEPKSTALLGSLLFIGGGYIYGGSRKTANYTTGTVSVTHYDGTNEAAAKVVTGSGVTWNTLVDAGMLFQRGNERVYAIASVDSSTQITLAEPYEGVTGTGIAYTLSPIYKMTAADPYYVADYYGVVQNRLLWGVGTTVRFSDIRAPHSHTPDEMYHVLPRGATIGGIAEANGTALIFTTLGTWAIRGMAFDIVGPSGNAQHQLAQYAADAIFSGVGVADWEGALVVPTLAGVFLMDGVSPPVRLSGNVDPLYFSYARAGYKLGQATVYRNHYFLPVLDSAARVKTLMVLRMDRRAFDRRRRITFPWSRIDGSGGALSALAVRPSGIPKLLGIESNTSARVLDLSYFFEPDSDHATDADGTNFESELVSRDYLTGNNTLNMVQFLRTNYELQGDGELQIQYGFGFRRDDLPYLGHPDGEYGAGFGPAVDGVLQPFTDSTGSEFHLIGTATDNHAHAEPKKCRVKKRTRFIRYRLLCNDAPERLVVRSLETLVRPSEAVRR